MNIVPPHRPQMTRKALLNRIAQTFPNEPRPPYPFIVFVRGYFSKTFGGPGNDRRVYDDAAFIVSDTECLPFHANTDPSGVRLGHGDGLAKGMASLKPGMYKETWGFGRHKGKYDAIIQTKGPVTVIRDGTPPETHTGWYGINIHRGGNLGTSSLGCQTIPPSQWSAFIAAAHSLFERVYSVGWQKRPVPVILMEFAAP